MPVTLHDIAKKTGVSVATASRALAGVPGVAAATQKRVLKVAQEMGYRPNVLAQRLQKQRTDTIGFIIPTFGPRFSDPYFSELLTGIGNEASVHEYDLLVSTHAPGPEELLAYERIVRERRADGVLVVRTRQDDARIKYLVEHNFPFVAFGRAELDIDFPYVDVDGETGLHTLVEHLISIGHRRIAFVNAPTDFMFSVYRLRGYKDALLKNNLPYEETLVETGGLTEQSGYEAGLRLLALDAPPTAIIAANDLMAFGVISAVQEKGLNIGKDIAVAGFDDIPMSKLVRPPLTTMRQPIYEIGRHICRMLLKLLSGDELEQPHVLLTPQLVIRQSTLVKS